MHSRTLLVSCKTFWMKYTYNETQQIVEAGDWLCNYPCNDPKKTCNSNPSSDPNKAVSMHVTRTTEDPNIDIFASNVTDDDTRDEYLH